MSDNANEELTKNEEEVVKKTSKKSVAIAALIGLVIGAILLCLFTPYKLLFSPKKMKFLNYMTKDVTEIKNMISDISENDLVKILSEGNKKIDFNFNLESKEISGTTLVNSEFLTLKLNNINENYLLLENNNLDTFWSKLGFEDYGLPAEINLENNSLNLTKSEKRKINNFVTQCAYNILENLENENFIETPQKTIEIQEQNKKYQVIEVQLSENDLLMLQKEMLVTLEKEGMLSLIVDKANAFGSEEVINKKELKEKLEKEIAYLDLAKAYNELNEEENTYYIIYRMYYDEANNVVARELTEKYDYQGNEYEDIIVSLISNEDYYELKLFNQEEDYSSAYYNIISDEITEEGNIQNHNITYAIEGFYVGYAEDGVNYEYIPINSSVSYDLKMEKAEDGLNVITFNDENSTHKFELKYNDNNVKAEFANEKLAIKAEVSSDNTTKKELINNGAILLNEKTQEEIINEVSNIGSKLSEIFTK